VLNAIYFDSRQCFILRLVSVTTYFHDDDGENENDDDDDDDDDDAFFLNCE
jgi:regulator of RNase E activity RraB